jgi:hypothetical protein
MDPFRSAPAPTSPQVALGYGNVSEYAIQAGIAAIGELLVGRGLTAAEGVFGTYPSERRSRRRLWPAGILRIQAAKAFAIKPGTVFRYRGVWIGGRR